MRHAAHRWPASPSAADMPAYTRKSDISRW